MNAYQQMIFRDHLDGVNRSREKRERRIKGECTRTGARSGIAVKTYCTGKATGWGLSLVLWSAPRPPVRHDLGPARPQQARVKIAAVVGTREHERRTLAGHAEVGLHCKV